MIACTEAGNVSVSAGMHVADAQARLCSINALLCVLLLCMRARPLRRTDKMKHRSQMPSAAANKRKQQVQELLGLMQVASVLCCSCHNCAKESPGATHARTQVLKEAHQLPGPAFAAVTGW